MPIHLRFGGRPASLPKPGERRSGPGQAKRPAALPVSLEWFAVASPGLEGVLAEELAALPEIGQTRAVAGGVEFAGPLAAGMAANLASRIATRILLRVGEVRARDFASLRRGLAKLAWRSFIPNDSPLRIDVTASHCRLYHTGALADTLALAVEDCLGKLPRREKGSVADEGRACTRLLLRGQDDRFLASVDSSGDLLHRRGWRIEAGPAPLRETLAAGILALCDYDPALPLVDPMCGSGTVAIEAAAVARALAPGGGRSFAFERWPTHDEGIWRKVRALRAGHARAPAQIFASDRDPRAVEMARRNAERAGLATDIQFAVAAFGKGAIPATPGLVVLNPPYGHRLEKRGNARRLARSLGQDLASCYCGWRAAVLCPDAVFVAAVSAGARRQPDKTFALRNGGLRVRLGVWSL